MNANGVTVGIEVGAGRWPYSACHPHCWLEPLVGIVLPLDDVRAWTDTISFAGRPARKNVMGHIAWLHSQGLLKDTVPVLWHTDSGEVIRWQTVSDLVSPQEDRLRWERARRSSAEALCLASTHGKVESTEECAA